MFRALRLIPGFREPAWWCVPIDPVLETRGSEVQGHPGLHSEFWAIVGYTRPVWSEGKEKKKKLKD